jgi:hypothetical protein
MNRTTTKTNNSIVVFNGKGSKGKDKNHILKTATMSYGNYRGQYKYLFSKINETVSNIDDYVVLCPLYQIRGKYTRPWLDKFDYQVAVTGKAKHTEPDVDGVGRTQAMKRELAEELNVNVNINLVDDESISFPKFKFGWGIINRYTIKSDNTDFDFRSIDEDYNRRIMVVVLERKDDINLKHINNNYYCENDIVGFIRNPLRDVLSDLLLL